MAEIIYTLMHHAGAASTSRIEWLSEHDCDKFNAHLQLAGQKPIDEARYEAMYQKGIARYCLLYLDGLPVARGAIEPYSKRMWEAADIRVAPAYRGRGLATDILRFLSLAITKSGKTATCRTEEDNTAMRRAMARVGYQELAIIKRIATESELDAALALEKKVFGAPAEQNSPAYARERWLERMDGFGDLMLYAQSGGEVAGIVFGRMESEKSMTVGPVAVDEQHRKRGIARLLMQELEKRALRHGIHHIALGAVESAEGFYAKLGYTGTLLIQSEKHSVDELLSLNTKYRVVRTNVYEGAVHQVFLELPVPDRELQRTYEATFPGCHTQMVFQKTI